MSVLQNFSLKVQADIKELQQLQQTRKKDKIDRGVLIGTATIREFNSEDKIVQQSQGEVHLTNYNGKLLLVCETLFLPRDLILWYQYVNNIITLHLKEDVRVAKIIMDMESVQQVENFISKVKPPEKPWPNAYQHDGNVTSSSADSDSGRSGTGGVDNSFESDNPSESNNSSESDNPSNNEDYSCFS